MTEIPRDTVVVLSGFLALVGASIEAESWGGLDNLFVPFGLHLILVSMAPADTGTILLFALAYAAAVMVSYTIARAHDVAQQPLRATILLVTVVLMTFGAINTLLLVAAVGVTLLANRIAPPPEEHADLHTVFAVIAIGLFWLLAGNAIGRDLIVFFSIAIATYSAAMAAIALRGQRAWALLAVGLISSVFILRIHLEGMDAGLTLVHMAVGLSGVIAVSALCLLRPGLIEKNRALKVTLLSLVFSGLSAMLMVI